MGARCGSRRATGPLLGSALAALALLACGREPEREAEREPGRDEHVLSPLAAPPDWSELDAYQGTMTREELVRLLDELYTTNQAHRSFITVHDTHAVVRTSPRNPERTYTLRFATGPLAQSARPRREPAPHAPLAGLTIAIDPGHIGGSWARPESRWFRIGGAEPVAEGDLTLRVARLLAERLREQGARVVLVRDQARPVTDATPRELEPQARAALLQRGELHGSLSPAQQRLLIERESVLLAYRTSEIRARARVVNEHIRPDLTISVHLDAVAWREPGRATLTHRNHVHTIVHGAYTADELGFEDMRYHLLAKLLSRSHEIELPLARTAARAMAEATGLGPPRQSGTTPHAIRVGEDGHVWARNLLANRLYRGPVLYLEPYVMNNHEVFERIQAGDYDGLRTIAGARRPSLFREYADAVTRGLVQHYGR